MHRNPWFTLILGLMLGLVFGYVFAERQRLPPPASRAAAPQSAQGGLPQGHPPIDTSSGGGVEDMRLAEQVAEVQAMLAQNPQDPRLMVALGNLYFDAGRWGDSRLWYERALAVEGGDPDVTTDLAVVYRNLEQPERALELLDQSISIAPDHWQSWYNKVVLLHFDLHRHDEAAAALERLQSIARSNPSVPDLSGLEAELISH
jgi:tetratricopeptide (TPR) repeat protein